MAAVPLVQNLTQLRSLLGPQDNARISGRCSIIRTYHSAVVHRMVVVTTRRRPVVRAMVTIVMMHRAVVDRVMHDHHATRLRRRQCRQRQRRNGQCNRNQKLLHGTPLLVETHQAWRNPPELTTSTNRPPSRRLFLRCGRSPIVERAGIGYTCRPARAYSSMVRAEDS